MAHVTTPRWQSPVSRRIVVIIIAAAAALMLLTSILVTSASAAGPERVRNVKDPACQELGFGVDTFKETIPRGNVDANYDEIVPLSGRSDVDLPGKVRLTAPPNRSFVTFALDQDAVEAGVIVLGAVLFNRTDQKDGNLYDYRDEGGVTSGILEPPPRDQGNEKQVVLCFTERATPTISTLASAAGFTGGTISDTATIKSDAALISGTKVTFELYPAEICGAEDAVPVFIGEASPTLVGGTAYEYTATVEFTDTEDELTPGTYYWVASYPGDASNYPVSGECGDEGETTEVYAEGIACDETIVVPGVEGDIATNAVVVRAEPTKGDCDTVLPTTLEITGTAVRLLFPETFENANLIIRIDWAASSNPDNLVVGTIREVDVNDDDIYVAGVGCTSSSLAAGEVPIIDEDPATPLPTVEHPVGVPICLVAQVLNGAQTQWWSVTTDPQWK
jgi:hypothetical protein